MEKKQLNKAFDAAKITPVKDREESTLRVFVKELNREFFVETTDKDEARKQALEIVLGESDRIRGFEITDAEK